MGGWSSPSHTLSQHALMRTDSHAHTLTHTQTHTHALVPASPQKHAHTRSQTYESRQLLKWINTPVVSELPKAKRYLNTRHWKKWFYPVMNFQTCTLFLIYTFKELLPTLIFQQQNLQRSVLVIYLSYMTINTDRSWNNARIKTRCWPTFITGHIY